MADLSPISDRIDNAAFGAPEISQEGGHSLSKREHSSYDKPKLKKSKTGLSWRTRLVGGSRAATVTESEVRNNGSLPSPPYEPIQDHENHYPLLSEDEMRRLGRNFHPPSQLYKLLFKGFLWWLLTAILCGALGCVLWYYSSIRPMNERHKETFNFLVIGLSLALGMNIVKSLKAMAVDVRWWVLSLKKRRLREVDLILHLDSLTAVFKLAFVAPRLAPACFSWLLLNLIAQVGVALIGLCYTPDSGSDSALIRNGTLLIPDMSQIYTEAHTITQKPDSVRDEQYTANNFGTIALSYYWNDTDHLPAPDTLWQANSPIIFDGTSYWLYVFQDTNFDAYFDPSITQPPTMFTDRTVNTTWACDSWPVVEGGNGTSTNLSILIDANGHFGNVKIPYAGGSNQTTFITNPDKSDCGPSCSTVYAFEASDTKPWWYECNMTLGETQNATLKEHQLGLNLTKMATAAIALQGHVVDAAQAKTGEQYQYYPASSIYGFPNEGSADIMGHSIGYFVMGVVATAAQWNPLIEVVGDQPNTGSQLQVQWDKITIIFGLTAGIQLFLFIFASVVANMVIVKDESFLATARLLRPIVDRMGPAGTYATGKQICKMLGDDSHEKVVYSVRHPQKGILHHLDLGHQKRLRAFPKGDYD